jgi:hypothetical protein
MAGMQENYKQQTALMQATRSGMTSMVEKLLAAGAKTETTDKVKRRAHGFRAVNTKQESVCSTRPGHGGSPRAR